MKEDTINWKRCVHINRAIDDDLLKELIPKILEFRQESNDPITLALNSPGGMVGLISTIKSLVQSSNQDGDGCQLITVATNKAYSAAAMLLALGDCAVALPHSEILFHDVRYGAVRDVTPTTALKAAETLEAGNDRAALEIAAQMYGRWMWMYLDIHSQATPLRERSQERTTMFETSLGRLHLPSCEHVRLDLVALLLFISGHLRKSNECILENALNRMVRWGVVTNWSKKRSLYRRARSRRLGSLDSLAQLFKEFAPDAKMLGGERNERDLDLFMTVLAASVSDRSAKDAIALASREMTLFSSMNDERHWREAMKLMLQHKFSFFTYAVASKWDSLSEQDRSEITEESKPIVRVLWLLCVQVARELFTGEHKLTPTEAMVLGLVDEVPGDAPFESRRQFSLNAAGA
ncbi:ATP-dependent Clp protease proteolytic subunit [Pelomonas sp. Root1444]|uniref:ATP-dependent Clp protease proteolytic subunit n=1 Tax=Pelomonas sp. Root1444 TaxID=1736464 RepID=UPI0009EBAE86|nr:ATP-dependent Clp protease proteolytic subunit [Pelomonas sp. Root1444]